MKVPFWIMVRIFRAVYKWAAVQLYIDTWTEREITALESENLIKQLSKILEVPIKHDTVKK
jgi:hypothetical protein